MKVILLHRHLGIHSPVKEVEIEGMFSNYYLGEDQINEELLLQNLPKDFLPVSPNKCLLTVQSINSKTGEVSGSTGQRGLMHFKNWAKYFDAYSLELCRD